MPNRGTSAVLGVILMVAIVVILGTVVGSFALGMTDSADTSVPTARFDATQMNQTYEDGCGASPQIVDVRTVEFTHQSGTIGYENLEVEVNGNPAYDIQGFRRCLGKDDKIRPAIGDLSVGGSFSIVTYATSEPVSNGTEVGYDEDANDRIKTEDFYAGNVRELHVGDTVTILYHSPQSDRKYIVTEYTVE